MPSVSWGLLQVFVQPPGYLVWLIQRFTYQRRKQLQRIFSLWVYIEPHHVCIQNVWIDFMSWPEGFCVPAEVLASSEKAMCGVWNETKLILMRQLTQHQRRRWHQWANQSLADFEDTQEGKVGYKDSTYFVKIFFSRENHEQYFKW